MTNQLTTNAEALRLFFTDELYLVKNMPTPTVEIHTSENADLQGEPLHAAPKIKEVIPVNLPNVEGQKADEQEKAWNFECIGKNQKRILILVNDPINKVSSTQGAELLKKLIKAIELTINDFALVNYANYTGATFKQLSSFFNCHLVLAFGIEPKSLDLGAYGPNELHVHEAVKLVFAKNLHDLDTDQESKKILWSTLQKLK